MRNPESLEVVQKPPADISLHSTVQRLWEPLIIKSLKGEKLDFDIQQIDRIIVLAEDSFRAGRLPLPFDWARDIRSAQLEHDFNKAAVTRNSSDLEDWRQFWKDRLAWSEKTSMQVVQELLKYVLALHGALAIACVTALSTDKPPVVRSLYVFGLLVSGVGILTILAGQYAFGMYCSHYFARVSGKLIRRRGWHFISAIPRWLGLRRMQLWLSLASWLMTASILFFAFYVFVFFLVVISR